MLDAIEVALETGAEGIRIFGEGAIAATLGNGRQRGQRYTTVGLAPDTPNQLVGPVGHSDWRVRVLRNSPRTTSME